VAAAPLSDRSPGDSLPALVGRYALSREQASQLERLLEALEAEPDPPTRLRARADALEGHLADSLTAMELEGVRGARGLADLGAGSGFPGLALAVALPDAAVDLIESARRKCAVIERLARAAALENARAVPARAEEWAVDEGRERYDAVTARALAPLAVLVEYAAPLLVVGGVLVAWKGARDLDEEGAGTGAAAVAGLEWAEVRRVVPFAGAHSRHLHVFRKVVPTPPRLPRRPGVALRRPLG
jgi:16S rRNA (guanine527-N7)-methyltransferase